eukprot:473220-Amphidinium_carterae.2
MKLRRDREPVREEPPSTPKKKEASPAAPEHARSSGTNGVRRFTRIHIYNGRRPLPPGPDGIDPQANICLADDFVDVMDIYDSEEEAIRAFLELPLDNGVLEGMREAFIECIGTSAQLFLIRIKEWRVIFDMSEEDFKEYLASNASAFPSAMTAENNRSKEEILRTAQSKRAARPGTTSTSGKKEHRDDHQEDNQPPEDQWASWRKKRGMSNLPPKKHEKTEKPDEPDAPGDRGSDRGSDKRNKKK